MPSTRDTQWQGAWRAAIHHGRQLNLGMFYSERAAAEAYDEAARRLKGKGVPVNFPVDGEPQAAKRRPEGSAAAVKTPGRPSKFRGVNWDKRRGRWRCRIKSKGKEVSLGRFDSEVDAARAYDDAARKLHGLDAYLNFPERGEASRTPSSRFHGVSWQNNQKSSWHGTIRIDNNLHHLGSFTDEKECARAYDVAVRTMVPPGSRDLNFPSQQETRLRRKYVLQQQQFPVKKAGLPKTEGRKPYHPISKMCYVWQNGQKRLLPYASGGVEGTVGYTGDEADEADEGDEQDEQVPHVKDDEEEEVRASAKSTAYGTQRLRTSVFASSRVERAMRRNTFQTETTDEPLLDENDNDGAYSGRWCLPIYTAQTQQKGIGAFAARDLQAREFIGEYAGEIICESDLSQCRDGGNSGDGGAQRAMSEYLFDLGDGLLVDAQPMGNATRRMNHAASKPNVQPRIVNHRGCRKVPTLANISV